MSVLLAKTTCPDLEVARTLARALVEGGAAACVNLMPGARSVYAWGGEVVEEEEVVLLIKTTAERMGRLRGLLAAHHPYELPELTAVEISDGSPAYIQWVEQQLGTETT